MAAGVCGDDGVAEGGKGGAEPLFAGFELAGVDIAEGHGLEDVVGKEAEAESGDEGGEIEGAEGVVDAAAYCIGVGGVALGLLELHVADEVGDPEHEDAAVIGKDLAAGEVGVAGLVEEDSLGEVVAAGLDEGTELNDLVEAVRPFDELIEDVELGVELNEGCVVGGEVAGLAGVEIAALARLCVLDEGLGLAEGDEDLLGVVDAGLIADDDKELTARDEAVGG